MNYTISIGNLTDDPKITHLEENTRAEFCLALNRTSKDGADFPRFVAWGKKAELVAQYCHKGMKLGIRGHIHTGSYENKEGKKVYTTDIFVDDVEFLSPKPKDETTGQSKENPEEGFMVIPDGIDKELPFA